MLCSQGAELATDCNQCERAKAPWNLEGVKLTLNSKIFSKPRKRQVHPHLDLNRSKLRFACKEQSLRQIATSTKERQLLVSLVVDYSTAKLTDISRF